MVIIDMFTKAFKSKTLMFNWIVTILMISFEALGQYFPILQGKIDDKWFVAIMLFVTISNKLLRTYTTLPLKEK